MSNPWAPRGTASISGASPDYLEFLEEATLYGYTMEEAAAVVSQQDFLRRGATVDAGIRLLERRVAPGYGGIVPKGGTEKGTHRYIEEEIFGGSAVSRGQWRAYTSARRAAMVGSIKPVQSEKGIWQIGGNVPRESETYPYYFPKGETKRALSVRSLFASHLGETATGEALTEIERGKVFKRRQQLVGHEQLRFTGLPTFRARLRAGTESDIPDVFTKIRAAYVVGGDPEAAGMGYIEADPRIMGRVEPVPVTHDFPDVGKISAKVGDVFGAGREITIGAGVSGFRSAHWHHQLTSLQRIERFGEDPFYRATFRRYQRISAAQIGAKHAGSKVLLSPLGGRGRRGLGEQIEAPGAPVQFFAAAKSWSGVAYEHFQRELEEADEAGIKRIARELGVSPDALMRGAPYSRIAERVHERFVKTAKKEVGPIVRRGMLIDPSREHLYKSSFVRGTRQEITRSGRPMIQADVRYWGFTGDIAKMFMHEPPPTGRQFMNWETVQMLRESQPDVGARTWAAGYSTRTAYQSLMYAATMTEGLPGPPKASIMSAQGRKGFRKMIRGAMQEAEARVMAEHGLEAHEVPDPRLLSRAFFDIMGERPLLGKGTTSPADMYIKWGKELVTPPLSGMRRFSATGDIEGEEVSTYLNRFFRMAQAFGSGARGSQLAIYSNVVAEAQEQMASANRTARMAQGTMAFRSGGKPGSLFGHKMLSSAALGPQQFYVPGLKAGRTVSFYGYPVQEGAFDPMMQGVTISKREVMKLGLSPHQMYVPEEFAQAAARDFDADIGMVVLTGRAVYDPKTHKFFDRKGRELSEAEVRRLGIGAIGQKGVAVMRGAGEIREELATVAGPRSRNEAVARIEGELLGKQRTLNVRQLLNEFQYGASLYRSIGPYYQMFGRYLHSMAEVFGGGELTKSAAALMQISHGRSQRPALLPESVQALQELGIVSAKSGLIQRTRNLRRWFEKGDVNLDDVALSLSQLGGGKGLYGIFQRTTHNIAQLVKKGELTPADAARLMAPKSKFGEAEQLFGQTEQLMSGVGTHDELLTQLRGIVGGAKKWSATSILGATYGGRFMRRVAKSKDYGVPDYEYMEDTTPDERMRIFHYARQEHGIGKRLAERLLGFGEMQHAYGVMTGRKVPYLAHRLASMRLFKGIPGLGNIEPPLEYMQAGGPVLPQGAYVVGEEGPEVFVPDRPGTIVPNQRTLERMGQFRQVGGRLGPNWDPGADWAPGAANWQQPGPLAALRLQPSMFKGRYTSTDIALLYERVIKALYEAPRKQAGIGTGGGTTTTEAARGKKVHDIEFKRLQEAVGPEWEAAKRYGGRGERYMIEGRPWSGTEADAINLSEKILREVKPAGIDPEGTRRRALHQMVATEHVINAIMREADPSHQDIKFQMELGMYTTTEAGKEKEAAREALAGMLPYTEEEVEAARQGLDVEADELLGLIEKMIPRASKYLEDLGRKGKPPRPKSFEDLKRVYTELAREHGLSPQASGRRKVRRVRGTTGGAADNIPTGRDRAVDQGPRMYESRQRGFGPGDYSRLGVLMADLKEQAVPFMASLEEYGMPGAASQQKAVYAQLRRFQSMLGAGETLARGVPDPDAPNAGLFSQRLQDWGMLVGELEGGAGLAGLVQKYVGQRATADYETALSALGPQPVTKAGIQWMRAAGQQQLQGIPGVGPQRAAALQAAARGRLWGGAGPGDLGLMQSTRGTKTGVGPGVVGMVEQGLGTAIIKEAERLASGIVKTADDIESIGNTLKPLMEMAGAPDELKAGLIELAKQVTPVARFMREWARAQLPGMMQRELPTMERQLRRGEMLDRTMAGRLGLMQEVEEYARRPGARGGPVSRRLEMVQARQRQLALEQGLGGGGRGGSILDTLFGGQGEGGIFDQFSMGWTAFRMRMIGYWTYGRAQQWAQQALPYQQAGLQMAVAGGAPYEAVMRSQLGAMQVPMARMADFRTGLGVGAQEAQLGFYQLLAGAQGGYERGRGIGRAVTPALYGLGVAGSLGAISAGLAGVPAAAGLAAGLGAAAAPLGIAIASTMYAGQIVQAADPRNINVQRLEYMRGYRGQSPIIDMLEARGQGRMRGAEWYQALDPTAMLALGGRMLTNLPQGISPTMTAQQIEEEWQQYVKSPEFHIDDAALHVKNLEIEGMDVTQKLTLGAAIMGATGMTNEQIAAGAGDQLMRALAPTFRALGGGGEGAARILSLATGAAGAYGIQGAGVEQFLLNMPATPAGQQAYVTAAGILGPQAERLGLGFSQQRQDYYTQMIESGTWTAGKAGLEAAISGGELPIVGALGLTPGSRLAQAISERTAPYSEAEANAVAQIASEFGQLGDVMGKTTEQIADMAVNLEKARRGFPEWNEDLGEWVETRAPVSRFQQLRDVAAQAGYGAQPFGLVFGGLQARQVMAPYQGLTAAQTAQVSQAAQIMGPIYQTIGGGAGTAGGMLGWGYNWLQQGVTPTALGIVAQQVYQQTGAVSQALGLPYGFGGTAEQPTTLPLLRQGMNPQQYQRLAAGLAYSQQGLGYAQMITGRGLGPQLLAQRAAWGYPTPAPGAAAPYEWGAPVGGITPVYGYMERQQLSTRRAQLLGGVGQNAQGQWIDWTSQTVAPYTAQAWDEEAGEFVGVPAGGTTFRMGLPGQTEQAWRNLELFNFMQPRRRRQFELNVQGQRQNIANAMESATLQFQHAMESLALQRTMWAARSRQQRVEFGFGYEQMMQAREWGREDFAFNRQVAGLQFGWQMEDYDRAIRFATGREKEQLIRQRGRAEEMYTIQEGRRGTEEERQEKLWQQEEERFARQIANFEEINALEAQQFDMRKRHLEESYAMQMRHLADAAGRLEENYELEKQIFDKQEEFDRTRLERAIALAQQEEKAAEASLGFQEAISNMIALMTGFGLAPTEMEPGVSKPGLDKDTLLLGIDQQLEGKRKGKEDPESLIQQQQELNTTFGKFVELTDGWLDTVTNTSTNLWSPEGIIPKGLAEIETAWNESKQTALDFHESTVEPIGDNGSVRREWNGFFDWLEHELWIRFGIGTGRKLQHGGTALAGMPAIVGEAGPELFVPPVSGSVVPNYRLGGVTIGDALTGRVGRGSQIGSITIQVTVPPGTYNERELAGMIGEEVVNKIGESQDLRGEPW